MAIPERVELCMWHICGLVRPQSNVKRVADSAHQALLGSSPCVTLPSKSLLSTPDDLCHSPPAVGHNLLGV
eukprot:6182170-Pleurochrysis_carterae.AAC.2